MTPAEFNLIPVVERFDALERFGVCLDFYLEKKPYQINLFWLWGFYVETFYNPVTDNVDTALAFDDYRKLDPYLAGIDLTPIFQY